MRKAEKEQGRRGMEYEVDLASGAEIDFRDNGDWKEVKAARGKAVPAAIVPAAISKYVAANFKGQTIVE
ncbi:MAG: PepSY-like domain-containing protein, partial [Muribaculaceae bacterium]|nr:PepSY-like domain-containing protein [Muribaculaceae bacterium]